MIKHFISLERKYYSKKEIYDLVKLSFAVKAKPNKYKNTLAGQSVGLIFEKPSLRTKTSFYVGAAQLGASPIYYAPSEVQLGGREKISDVAQVMSRYLGAVVLRTFEHKNVLELAKHSTIPVINGLSDYLHPSQVLGDLMTLSQFKKNIAKIKFSYIGDGNNVCNSLLLVFSLLGINISVATPAGYEPNQQIISEAKATALRSGAKITITNNAKDAAKNADVLYADVWTSMGKEKEQNKRKEVFKDYQINQGLVKLAKTDAIVMHCLPAHRGQEITDQVIDSKQSVVFAQAQNRLYSAKAIMLYVLGK